MISDILEENKELRQKIAELEKENKELKEKLKAYEDYENKNLEGI